MIISSDTIDILKNYAEINQSLLFKQGSVLKTINEQTNVLAKVTLSESFPNDFAIYDLNKFLGVLSLFYDPQLEFKQTSVVIQASRDGNNYVVGDQIAEYQFANKSLFEEEEKILAKDINLPSIDAQFELQEKYLSQLMRAAAVMSLPEIAVLSDGNKMSIRAIDSKSSIDSFSVDLGTSSTEFKMIFKIENIKLMKGSYNVQLSNQGLGHFSHLHKSLEYWIATETSPQ